MDMDYVYKYLHVLFFDDTKFYEPFVRTLCKNKSLSPNEHIFITDKENVYIEIGSYENVFYVKTVDLYKYMKKAKWIFFHAMPLKRWQIILLPNVMCNRIIWRTWGHDIRPWEKTNKRIYDMLKYIEFKLFKTKVKHFYAMGVANDIDIINIEEVFENKFKYFKMNYSDSAANLEILKNIKSESDNFQKNILVGHNCSLVDNHLEILEKLSKFKNENIHLIIPLSYSNAENGYKEQVIEKAYQIFGMNKVTIMNDFIPKEEYIKLISRIDVAIMDMYHSNGLGNVSYILYFKKKLYIKKGGNMDKAFLKEGIIPNYSSDITCQSFEEFIDNSFDNRYMKFCDDLYNKYAFQSCWEKIMEQCEDS